MSVALDTSVLAYAEGVGDAVRVKRALDVVGSLGAEHLLVPVQALGELFLVLVRKKGIPANEARMAAYRWRDTYRVQDTSSAVFSSAVDLVVTHRLQVWDAIIVAAAAEAGARVVLSEDMQHGFVWRDVTVVNPFGANDNESYLAPYLMR